MGKEELENLTKGPRPVLRAIEPDWDTLLALVQRAVESLGDACNESNGLATRFTAAYGAAFWLARVALEALGYRLASVEGHRTMLFQTLDSTLGWNPERWRRLDDFHRFRNRFEYGDMVEVPEQFVNAAIEAANELLDDVMRAYPRTQA